MVGKRYNKLIYNNITIHILKYHIKVTLLTKIVNYVNDMYFSRFYIIYEFNFQKLRGKNTTILKIKERFFF